MTPSTNQGRRRTEQMATTRTDRKKCITTARRVTPRTLLRSNRQTTRNPPLPVQSCGSHCAIRESLLAMLGPRSTPRGRSWTIRPRLTRACCSVTRTTRANPTRATNPTRFTI
uniref:(northern house mosquito) hypothetical protein n=1 Tax=Culex pipiens TaxID=7175 RepID=A0A8D8CVS6_CULPI